MNLIEIFKKFPSQAECIAHLEKVRWGDKPICPYCKSQKSHRSTKENRHFCHNCKTSYSVTVGTIFHDSRLPLQKWFLAISLVLTAPAANLQLKEESKLNAKKGISSRQLARDIDVNVKTAWSMQMRIRKAMLDDGILMTGICEMDECYIGGKPKKSSKDHSDNGPKNPRGRGTKKIAVMGIASRNGKVTAKKAESLTSKVLTNFFKKHVDHQNAELHTDEYRAYSRFKEFITHHTINHSEKEYARDGVHTNTIEGFWSLLKRGIIGQYHKLSAKYLDKYIAEFCFRYNNCKNTGVFALVLNNMVKF